MHVLYLSPHYIPVIPTGAYEPDRCDLEGGQCDCKPNVQGLKCDECKPCK